MPLPAPPHSQPPRIISLSPRRHISACVHHAVYHTGAVAEGRISALHGGRKGGHQQISLGPLLLPPPPPACQRTQDDRGGKGQSKPRAGGLVDCPPTHAQNPGRDAATKVRDQNTARLGLPTFAAFSASSAACFSASLVWSSLYMPMMSRPAMCQFCARHMVCACNFSWSSRAAGLENVAQPACSTKTGTMQCCQWVEHAGMSAKDTCGGGRRRTEVVSRGLDRHASAVEAKGPQRLLALQTLISWKTPRQVTR